MNLPTGPFGAVIADPPWQYKDSGKATSTLPRTVKADGDLATGVNDLTYPTMSTPEICALDVNGITDDNAVLFLWVTNPFLPDGFQVMRAWGFDYVTCITWGKVKKKRADDFEASMTVGWWFRSASEHVLFGVKRGAKRPGGWPAIPTLALHERLPHSTKPDFVHEMVEHLLLPTRRLEMFARRQRDGWETWGNQVAAMELAR